jgi:hypothetical protein
MISATDIVTSRFQLAVLVALLCQVLQSVAMPPIVSAAEPETQRRHSLIHRSAVESATLPATTQGTIIQPPGAEPPRSTSPIEPPKPSASLPTLPFPHHRTLTKHPAIATITAPATAPQTVPGAPTSGIAAGQVTQTTADTAKGTVPPATVPTTKSAATSPSGVTSTGAVAVAPSASLSSTSSAGSHSVASAGSSSASSSPGSRSALNLIKNSSIATLLRAPTPVVTTPPSSSPPSTPPSTPPPSTPPSTPPPPSPSTGSLTLTWTANGEPDLAGYKIYVGTASGTYNFPASPLVIGKVTSYTVANLPNGQTYFIAMSAYDSAGNESPHSAEVSKSLF